MSSEKGRNDIRPGQHPFSSTGRVEGGSESYEVYGTKGYYKTFQPQYKGRPLKHTEMDFNIDLIGQVIRGYRVVGNDTLVPDEIDLVNDLDNLLTFTSRDMIDAEGNTVYEDDGTTPKVEYIWQLIDAGSLSGSKGSKGEPGVNGAKGAQGAQGLQGLTGAQGLTGVKGNTGSQGAQGIPGAAANGGLMYMYTRNVVDLQAPSAMSNGKSVLITQDASFVINVGDVFNVDHSKKLKSLLLGGTFDLIFVDHNTQSKHEVISFKDVAVVDQSSSTGLLFFYASRANGMDPINPAPVTRSGEITYESSVTTPPYDIPMSNMFIDKWIVEKDFLNINVVPYAEDVDTWSAYENDFIVIHPNLVGWTLESITASWGAVIGAGCPWKIIHIDELENETTITSYTHPDNTRIHTEIVNVEITELGTIFITPLENPPSTSAQGYTVTLKFVKY